MTQLEERIEGVKRSYPIPIGVGHEAALDVGCNLGAFPIAYKERFSRFCFLEASKQNYEAIKANLHMTEDTSRNKLTGLNLAAYSVSGIELKLYEHSTRDNGSRSLLQHPEWLMDSYETVTTISFKDTLKIFNLGDVDYMKVDIEGGEYEYLMGQDLSMVGALGIELHFQIGNKREELMEYLLRYFNPVRLITIQFESSYHLEGIYARKKQ